MTIYQYPDYMYHYGVKGMKWGVRKAQSYVTSAGNAADRTLSNPNNRTLFGENAVGRNRRAAKQHNIATRERVTSAKSTYKSAKKSGSKTKLSSAKSELKSAKSARRKNLAGRAATQMLGFTDSGRGSYYRNRELGKGKVESALNAYGRQFVTANMFSPKGAVVMAGEQVLRKQGIMR